MNKLQFLPVNDLVVLIPLFYDSKCFIKVNEPNIKKKWTSAFYLLDEVETDQAREELDEIKEINPDSETAKVHEPKSPQEIVHQKRTGIDVLPFKSCTKQKMKMTEESGVACAKLHLVRKYE
ncbi:hypothetical protein TNCV_2785911 [Trichonephila clavipes]|nr:hypothetical protein TNCV_2785911 [Trichonephila clavipes]